MSIPLLATRPKASGGFVILVPTLARFSLLLATLLALSPAAHADSPGEKEAKPSVETAKPALPFTWPAPKGWRKETIPFPLDFAPGLTYDGLEELRFAPGMFQAGAEDFWTYAFVWWVKTPRPFAAPAIEKDLEAYFRGLAEAVAKSKPGMDPSQADYRTRLVRVPGRGPRLVGTSGAFDAFRTGKALRLNLRAFRADDGTQADSAWIFLLSPQPFSHPIWTELKELGKSFRRR